MITNEEVKDKVAVIRKAYADHPKGDSAVDVMIAQALRTGFVLGRSAAEEPLSEKLRKLADDRDLLWHVARRAVEEELIEMRDSGISLLGRNNGLVVKYSDGSPSDIIRLGPEMAVATALKAIADHLDGKGTSD